MITIHEVEQGTDAWLRLREGLYTGSGAEKLLQYANRYKLVDGERVPYALSDISNFKGNYYTKRGHILEDEAIELYESIKEVTISRPGFITNSDFPECGYSPDGMDVGATIEVKAFEKEKHMAMLKGDIPAAVQAQCHFGMTVCEKRRCILLPYNPDVEDPKDMLGIIEIKYNPKIATNFRRILNANRQAVPA